MSATNRIQNVLLMVLSCALAAVLWLHVQSQTTPPKDTMRWPQLDIRMDGLSEEYVVVSKAPTVIVTATGVDEAKIADSKPTAYIDLSAAKPGRNVCPVMLAPPPGVRAEQLRLRPRVVEVVVDRFVTVRKTVTLKTRGLQPKDLIYRDAIVQPVEVDVSGPNGRVSAVEQVRAILDLSRSKPGSSIVVPVEALDINDKLVSLVSCDPKEVTVRPTLAPAPRLKSLIIIPKWTGQPAFGYEIASIEVTPNEVQAKGESTLLASLTTVETERIPIDGIKQDTTIDVRIKLPAGVKITAAPTVSVRVKVRQAVGEPPPKVGP